MESEKKVSYLWPFLSPFKEGIGVRPTQLTIRKPALQKFRPGYDLFQKLHECLDA